MNKQAQNSGPFSASPRYARHWFWLALTAFVVIPVFWLTDLDITVARWFYDPKGTDRWPLAQTPLWQLVNIGTPVLALALGLSATAGILIAMARRSWRPAARPALFLLLTLVVGAGLLVNELFKENWGRPRPRQVEQLGGDQTFLPPLKPNFGGPGTSFASGHTSVGFSLAMLWLLVPATRRRLGLAFLAAGTGVGLLIGVGRFTEGAHFPSDVVFSALLTYAAALLVLRGLDSRWGRKLTASTREDRQRPLIAGVLAIIIVSALAGHAILSVPYDSTQKQSIPLTDYQGKIVRLEIPRGLVRVTHGAQKTGLQFTLMSHGYGLPNSEVCLELETESDEELNVRMVRNGIFSRVLSLVHVRLPANMVEPLHIVVDEGSVEVESPALSATSLSIQVADGEIHYRDPK